MGLTRSSLARAGLVAALASGCYSSGGRGKAPVDDEMYYPVAVSVTPSGKYLLVANSDFDLAYNSGTVQAYDLEAIAEKARGCEATPEPAGCDGVDAKTYVKASVRIGAFASDLRVVPLYDYATTTVAGVSAVETTVAPDVSRALIPVRGDATLTYIDVREGAAGVTLDCYAGAKANQLGNDCDANHRVGQIPTADSRQLTLEGEPFAIATPSYWSCPRVNGASKCGPEPARSGGIAGIVHQVSGDVSVFRDTQRNGAPPVLTYTLTGLPGSGAAIAPLDLLPKTAAEPFVPRFLVANRSQASLLVTQYIGDDGNPDRGALAASAAIPIPTQSGGYDTRGVVVDPPGAGESRPTRVFLASRSPASLVVGQIDDASGALHFFENVPLPIGPARLTRSTYKDSAGVEHTRVYVASYDSAYVVAYDPDARRVGQVIKAGRGPYSIAVDPKHKLAYVANFVDGTIQVIELDAENHEAFFERVVFTVGKPQGPHS